MPISVPSGDARPRGSGDHRALHTCPIGAGASCTSGRTPCPEEVDRRLLLLGFGLRFSVCETFAAAARNSAPPRRPRRARRAARSSPAEETRCAGRRRRACARGAAVDVARLCRSGDRADRARMVARAARARAARSHGRRARVVETTAQQLLLLAPAELADRPEGNCALAEVVAARRRLEGVGPLRAQLGELGLRARLSERIRLHCCFLQRHERDFTYTRRPSGVIKG